jgi:hypothetical protein
MLTSANNAQFAPNLSFTWHIVHLSQIHYSKLRLERSKSTKIMIKNEKKAIEKLKYQKFTERFAG